MNVGEMMAKEKKISDSEELKTKEDCNCENSTLDENQEENSGENAEDSSNESIEEDSSDEAGNTQLESELLDKLQRKEKECEDYLDMLKRTMADFDNYRKRTQKEKEGLFDEGFSEAVKQILPVLDNFERAVAYNDMENKSIIEGIEMILKIFKDTLQKMGVVEIPALGERFDPDYHNAIMHIEDESLEENIIVDVMQKGYKYKDKILRHSMVKVAN